jgi:hypothetical protein
MSCEDVQFSRYECNQKHGSNHVVEPDLYPTLAGMTGPEAGGMFGQKRPIINKQLNEFFSHRNCNVEYERCVRFILYILIINSNIY